MKTTQTDNMSEIKGLDSIPPDNSIMKGERLTRDEIMRQARAVWQALTPEERAARRREKTARAEERAERKARRALTQAEKEDRRAERQRRAKLHEEIAAQPLRPLEASEPSFLAVKDYRPIGFCESCRQLSRDMATDSLCLDCQLCGEGAGESPLYPKRS